MYYSRKNNLPVGEKEGEKRGNTSITVQEGRERERERERRVRELRWIHNTTQCFALHCITLALTLVTTQFGTRIDLDSIFAFFASGHKNLAET